MPGIIQSRIASVGSVATPRRSHACAPSLDERRAVIPALERAGEDLAGDPVVLRDQDVHMGAKLLHNWRSPE